MAPETTVRAEIAIRARRISESDTSGGRIALYFVLKVHWTVHSETRSWMRLNVFRLTLLFIFPYNRELTAGVTEPATDDHHEPTHTVSRSCSDLYSAPRAQQRRLRRDRSCAPANEGPLTSPGPREADPDVRDDDVDRLVFERERLDQALMQLDVGEAHSLGAPARLLRPAVRGGRDRIARPKDAERLQRGDRLIDGRLARDHVEGAVGRGRSVQGRWRAS